MWASWTAVGAGDGRPRGGATPLQQGVRARTAGAAPAEGELGRTHRIPKVSKTGQTLGALRILQAKNRGVRLEAEGCGPSGAPGVTLPRAGPPAGGSVWPAEVGAWLEVPPLLIS